MMESIHWRTLPPYSLEKWPDTDPLCASLSFDASAILSDRGAEIAPAFVLFSF